MTPEEQPHVDDGRMDHEEWVRLVALSVHDADLFGFEHAPDYDMDEPDPWKEATFG